MKGWTLPISGASFLFALAMFYRGLEELAVMAAGILMSNWRSDAQAVDGYAPAKESLKEGKAHLIFENARLDEEAP